MNFLKPVASLAAVYAVFMLAGCSDKQAGNPSPATAAPTSGLINACALPGQAAVEQLIGTGSASKSNTVLTENSNEMVEKSGDCTINAAGGKFHVYFTAFVWKTEDGALASYSYGQNMANSGKIMDGVKTQAVAGIGTSAYTYNYAFGPGYVNKNVSLVVRDGKKVITVSMENFTEDNARQIELAKPFASAIDGKL